MTLYWLLIFFLFACAAGWRNKDVSLYITCARHKSQPSPTTARAVDGHWVFSPTSPVSNWRRPIAEPRRHMIALHGFNMSGNVMRFIVRRNSLTGSGTYVSRLMRRLPRIYGELLVLWWGRGSLSPLPSPALLRNSFLISLMPRSKRCASRQVYVTVLFRHTLDPAPATFEKFDVCSADDVRRIINASQTKTSELDPLPTDVLKQFLPELLPYIIDMCMV